MRDVIEELQSLYRWLVKFITVDIWHLDLDDFGKAKRRMLKYLQIAIVTIKHVGNDNLGLNAIALTFFSTMSVAPFAALAFAVTSSAGLEEKLKELLLESFTGNEEVVNYVIQFANNIIESGQQGSLGRVSAFFFIWIVIWLMINIDRCFSRIWNVERKRSLAKRVLYYFGILITAPFIIVIFMSVFSVFSNGISEIGFGIQYGESIGFVLRWLLFFAIILFTFTVMYKYIPNVKVHFSAAFNAAIIAAVAFVILQYLYMETQMLVSRLNAVYGAFAAVPLFLIWMNISWIIILSGAEISHAFQYVDKHNTDKNSTLGA